MGFIGSIAKGAAKTAIGYTAGTYMVRGIDKSMRARAVNHVLTDGEIIGMLIERYMSENMLPVDARARASADVAAAQQRLKAKGYTASFPNAEAVMNKWTDYCRALMALESVRVPDIQEWWATHGVVRELEVMRSQQAYSSVLEQAKAAGHDDAAAARYAWKHVPVFGDADLRPDRDPDYAPLPAELMGRVDAFRGTYAHPFDTGDISDAALASPTMNGYLRLQAKANAL